MSPHIVFKRTFGDFFFSDKLLKDMLLGGWSSIFSIRELFIQHYILWIGNVLSLGPDEEFNSEALDDD